MSKQLKERVQVGTDSTGKAVYKWATGSSKQELFQNAARILNEHGQQEHIAKDIRPFKEYSISWLNLYKEGNIRHTTMAEYRSLLNKHLIPAFGDMNLSEITTDAIQAMLNEKRGYSKKTNHEMLMLLRAILDSAMEDGYITRNPAKSKRIKNPSKRKEERIPLTDEQINDVIAHISMLKQGRDRRYVALLSYTCMRREEILGLQWDDCIHIRRAVTFSKNRAVIGDTKNEMSMRTIPMPDALRQWLTKEDENQLFVIQDHVSQSFVKRMWERIQKRINVYGATPYCFRHTFTTRMYRAGINEKTMQKIGGWSDVSTMRNIYTHVQEQDLLKAADAINGMFMNAERGGM